MPLRVLVLCALAGGALALSAATAAASDGRAADGIRVGPGRYLVDAAELGGPAGPAPVRSSSAREHLRASPSPRIVGGAPTAIDQWPWQLALTLDPGLFAGNAYNRQICGASLVAPTVAITAAHCVFDDDLLAFFNPELFATVSGRSRLSATGGQEIEVKTYMVLVDAAGVPLYNPQTARWDAVLLVLKSSASGAPIKLAGADERAVWAAGREAFVTGWGTTAEGSNVGSDLLRVARVSMIDDGACGLAYPGGFFSDVMTCAGLPQGGADSCQGDSGGPLVVPIAGGGFRLVGDTSFGDGCGRPGAPGVYGRLADDPMRSALRAGALELAGVDIVGSGAQPPDAPLPLPARDPTCDRARAALERAQAKVRGAKRALRRADGRAETKRAKRKLARAKLKRRLAERALVACS